MSLLKVMAARLFNRIGQLGLGVAVVGSVVNTALYNGRFHWEAPECFVCVLCVFMTLDNIFFLFVMMGNAKGWMINITEKGLKLFYFVF